MGITIFVSTILIILGGFVLALIVRNRKPGTTKSTRINFTWLKSKATQNVLAIIAIVAVFLVIQGQMPESDKDAFWGTGNEPYWRILYFAMVLSAGTWLVSANYQKVSVVVFLSCLMAVIFLHPVGLQTVQWLKGDYSVWNTDPDCVEKHDLCKYTFKNNTDYLEIDTRLGKTLCWAPTTRTQEFAARKYLQLTSKESIDECTDQGGSIENFYNEKVCVTPWYDANQDMFWKPTLQVQLSAPDVESPGNQDLEVLVAFLDQEDAPKCTSLEFKKLWKKS